MRTFFSPAAALASAFLLAGCLPDDLTDYDWKALQPAPSPAPVLRGRVLVGSADVGGVHATLSIDEGPREGANVAYVTGAPGATLDAACGGTPMPVEPAPDVPEAAARVFLLPEAAGAACEIGVRVGAERAAFPVAAEASPTTLQRVADAFVAWQAPAPARVGRAPLVLRLFDARRQPLDAAALALYPYMDMGGGTGHSTPFRAPVRTAPGRYDGDIDFVMSGRWDLTVYLTLTPGQARTEVRFAGFHVYDP